ncbi:helicase RepA family protein [bacterium]|nr:helicase RepA family protein [bacterium]
MIIHHSGKDRGKGARWHSSLRAAVDTEIEVKADGLTRFATAHKQRDLENGKKVAFSLMGVQLGFDEDGDPITSCVVKPEELSSCSSHDKRRLKGKSQIALQALYNALADDGRKLHDAENYPQNRNVVSIDRWRHSYMRMRADNKVQESSIRRAFLRHVKELEEQDFTRSYDDNVWLVDDEDRQDK